MLKPRSIQLWLPFAAADLNSLNATMTGHDHNDHELPQRTRAYQQEMLDASLNENIIIALETGAGTTSNIPVING